VVLLYFLAQHSADRSFALMEVVRRKLMYELGMSNAMKQAQAREE
jgi:hypothetical protein